MFPLCNDVKQFLSAHLETTFDKRDSFFHVCHSDGCIQIDFICSIGFLLGNTDLLGSMRRFSANAQLKKQQLLMEQAWQSSMLCNLRHGCCQGKG